MSSWLGEGFRDTFRELFPTLRAATHFGAKGGGGSCLDYILATDPQSLCVVGAAVHAGALWPFDHLPTLADFRGASAPVPSSAPGVSLRWRKFLRRVAAAEANPGELLALQRTVRDALPFPGLGAADDDDARDAEVISRLEGDLEEAANYHKWGRPDMAHRLLDRVALALQGIAAHVINEVEGKTSSKPQSGPRPPAHPQGSVWAHLSYAVRSLRRAAVRARLAPETATPDLRDTAS